MDKIKENDDILNLLDNAQNTFSIDDIETIAFRIIQENSNLVQNKLQSLVGDISINIMERIWKSMNLNPMDFIKRLEPEQIVDSFIDCTAKEVVTVIRFLDIEQREKVIKLISGEDPSAWREAEKHVEKNIVKLFPDK